MCVAVDNRVIFFSERAAVTQATNAALPYLLAASMS